MLIPYNTDAPIYHLPIATVAIIVLNIVIFSLTTFGVVNEAQFRESSWLMIETQTINPLQWVTNNFMHADLLHLLGNMFFLWGFGLVIEGKLGWLRFTAVYLLIGTVYGAFIQIATYCCGVDTLILGASAAIFGLMGIALIWAPKNDLSCVLLLGVFSRLIQIPIQVFGAIYFGLQLLPFVFGGIHLSSELLHIIGLAVGAPIGIAMLKWKWVDCERWDIFNVMRGTNTRLLSEKDPDAERLLEQSRQARGIRDWRAKTAPENEAKAKPKRQPARKKSLPAAAATAQPTEKRQVGVVQKSINEAITAGNWRVAISIMLQSENQPRAAVKVLKQAESYLNPVQRKRAVSIVAAAKKQLSSADQGKA